MNPSEIEPDLVLIGFVGLALALVGFFAYRAWSARRAQAQVLQELTDLLTLAARRALPFPEVLEGFAQSLERRGSASWLGGLAAGRRGRLRRAADRAYAFSKVAREGGLAHALETQGAGLIPAPYLGWLLAGHAQGALLRTLETIRAQLRLDQRRPGWGGPLVLYVVFGLGLCWLTEGLSLPRLREIAVDHVGDAPSAPRLWTISRGLVLLWLALLAGMLLVKARAGRPSALWDRVPGVGGARRLRAQASRLRLLECGLRAGLAPQDALALQADAGDRHAARALTRVREGQDPLAALGCAPGAGSGVAYVELVGARAAELERAHTARVRALVACVLPLGLVALGGWVLAQEVTVFGEISRLQGGRPW
ncbi:MAG: hypothetical protein R3F62_08515 [Planctomycetota bacterium]